MIKGQLVASFSLEFQLHDISLFLFLAFLDCGDRSHYIPVDLITVESVDSRIWTEWRFRTLLEFYASLTACCILCWSVPHDKE